MTQIMFLFAGLVIAKEVQIGNDQEKAQSERNLEKTKLTIKYLYLENI